MLREDYVTADINQKNINEKIKLKAAENYKNIKRWTRKVDIF